MHHQQSLVLNHIYLTSLEETLNLFAHCDLFDNRLCEQGKTISLDQTS